MKYSWIFKASLIFGSAFSVAANAAAEETSAAEQNGDYIEWVGANSGVNWSSGQVTAEGAGVGPANKPAAVAKLLACRAAVVDAQRNLMESISGVRVTSLTVVSDMMLEKDVIKSAAEGVVKGATIVARQHDADGACTVTMIAPIDGKLSKAIYNDVFTQPLADASQDFWQKIVQQPLPIKLDQLLASAVDTSISGLIGTAIADTKKRDPEWQSAVNKLNSRLDKLESLLADTPKLAKRTNREPTGIVIDARGSNFIPSMSPKIRKIRAGVLFPNQKHQLQARERGQLVSLFTRSLNTAKRHPIVGERPVVLKALRTFGDTRTEIVLGKQSSARLEKLIAAGRLEDAGVIIVL